MVIIGLLSDSHGFYDETLDGHFRHCDEIWHAGDIGDPLVISRLKQLAPIRAVYGNIDDKGIREAFPEDDWIEREGVSIWITHIAGKPPRYTARVTKRMRDKVPDVLVCGHSHVCQVQKDEKYGLLFINPGASGHQGFHSMRTAMRLELGEGRIKKLEVIELGKRGSTSLTT